MIMFRDPPPLRVRVQSLAESRVPPKFRAPIREWALAMLAIVVGGVLATGAKQRSAREAILDDAFRNSLPRQVEAGVLAALPVGTPMREVRARLDAIHAVCRSTSGDAPQESLLVCLGTPIVRDNSYTRFSIRFVSHNGALNLLAACPVLVHWKRQAVPSDLASRVNAHLDRGCWRDESNPAENDWSYGLLPDHPFTVSVVHGADSVTRRTSPTTDTLIVQW